MKFFKTEGHVLNVGQIQRLEKIAGGWNIYFAASLGGNQGSHYNLIKVSDAEGDRLITVLVNAGWMS